MGKYFELSFNRKYFFWGAVHLIHVENIDFHHFRVSATTFLHMISDDWNFLGFYSLLRKRSEEYVFNQFNSYLWGGGQGGLNLPLPVPFNPGSRPVFFGSRPFEFIRLRNIAQCCVIFPFFSRFPLPWESRFPPPLLPPPVHLPPPFLPVSRPPVPPHILGKKRKANGAKLRKALFIKVIKDSSHGM